MGGLAVFLSASPRGHLDRPPGVSSEAVPVRLVSECSMPVAKNVARQPRPSYRVTEVGAHSMI
jgi:hypothetical protein